MNCPLAISDGRGQHSDKIDLYVMLIAALVSLSPPNLKDCSEEQSFSTATLIAGLSGRPLRLLQLPL